MHLVTYMRISVTDRCNERCAYCMPHDVAIEWLPRGQTLSYEEVLRVARVATSLGVTKFRVTGGEPLVRKNVAEFIGELNKLPGVTDIDLSTNATLLAPLAHQLRANGVNKVNISLDSLDAETYRELSGNGRLADVLTGIDAAIDAGSPQVNVTMVRLTADGKLRPCLGAHLEYDLKPVLRAVDTSDAKLREVFVQTIRNKPEEHEFRNNYVPGRKMIAIGG